MQTVVSHLISHLAHTLPQTSYRLEDQGNKGCMNCIGRVLETLEKDNQVSCWRGRRESERESERDKERERERERVETGKGESGIESCSTGGVFLLTCSTSPSPISIMPRPFSNPSCPKLWNSTMESPTP